MRGRNPRNPCNPWPSPHNSECAKLACEKVEQRLTSPSNKSWQSNVVIDSAPDKEPAGMRILLLTFLLSAQRPSVKPAVPAGTVTGRLSTAEGGVAAGIRVSAMAAPDSSKTPAEATALVSLTETDSSGRYRLENVPPGRYYIVAGLLESSTYYPGVKSPADAKMVDVTSRATVTGIDFQVARFSTGLTVSGRVVRESNQPLGVAFQVGLGGSDQYFNTTTKFDGSFEFLKVRPGNYTLNVNPVPGGQPRSIVVGDKDVTGIEFIVPWTVDVSGRVLVDGG